MPQIAEGPKPQPLLDVPPRALKSLSDAGRIRPKTYTKDSVAIVFWYRAEDYPPPTRDCSLMDLRSLDNVEAADA